MKTDDAFVKDTAKKFVSSSAATIWPFVGDEIRDALIDQAVMDRVRTADDERAITPRDLVAFREALIETLRVGVFVGKTKRGVRFDRDREEALLIRLRMAEEQSGAQ